MSLRLMSNINDDTDVGLTAAQKLKPMSLVELANGNSLMRLMPMDGEMNPIDKYALFKENPSLWDQEMVQHGLSKEEREILHEHYDYCSGVPSAQEDIMRMVMDPRVLNKDLLVANKFRKIVAKKQAEAIEELKKEYAQYGKESGASKELLNYVWHFTIEPQLGYGFSISHSIPYSAIAVQEMNLFHHFNPVYWNCACLSIEAGAQVEGEEEEEVYLGDDAILEEYEEDEEEKAMKRKKKSTDYGAIASAIGSMNMRGIKVSPPDINVSNFDFKPDAENDLILFGLKGLNSIGDDLIGEILDNRPYESIDELRDKVKLNKTHMINLIKSGALDSIAKGKTKKENLYNFLLTTAETRKQVTIATVPRLLQLNLLPQEEYIDELGIFVFNRHIKKINKGNKGAFYNFDDKCTDFFIAKVGADVLNYDKPTVRIDQKWWDKYYTKTMDPIRNYIKENKDDMLDVINKLAIKTELQKYAMGSESFWEMESISYYYGEHELIDVEESKYDIESFFELDEEPDVKMIVQRQGRPCPLYNLHTIAGTVIDKDKTRRTVTLLTVAGVVIVKLYSSQFSYFDKQISEPQSDGTKKIMERTWFKRGNKLLVTGIRRGNQFFPKTYRNSKKSAVYLVSNINDDGSLILRNERYKVKEQV